MAHLPHARLLPCRSNGTCRTPESADRAETLGRESMGAVIVVLVLGLVLWVLWSSEGGTKTTSPLAVAIQCPHCQTARVELAVRLYFIRGFLLFCRYGSKYEVGCRSCVRTRITSAAVTTLVTGWWSYPWGVATPYVVLQNLWQLGKAAPGCLAEFLRLVGIDADEVTLDDDGMTGEQRRLLGSIVAATARLAAVGPRECIEDAGARVASEVTGGKVSRDSAIASIKQSTDTPVSSATFDLDTRILLLRIAVEIASAAGRPAGALLDTLVRIGAELGFDEASVRFTAGIGEDERSTRTGRLEPEADVAAAAAVLGLAPDADLLTLRARYRALIVQYHPDHAVHNGVDELTATRRTQEINEAYEVMTRSSRVGVA